MDELVKQISERTGVSEEQARTAVDMVLKFVKERLPEPLANQVDGFMAGGEGGGSLGDVAGKLGGLFGN